MNSKTTTNATTKEAKPALEPKLRFPEFRHSAGWKTKFLGDLCKIRTGKKDANEGASDGKYPFFTCAENHIFSNSYSFDAEAILIAGNANVGQTRYYCGKFEAYQRTYVLTDFSGISVPYLYAILNANLRNSLLAQVQVGAMSYIKLPMLQKYELAVPPSPAEQRKIAECLSSVDELIAAQARKLDALKTHKKGLMQQLFPREGETQPRLRFPEFQNAGEWNFTTVGGLIEEGCLFPPKDGNHGSIHPKSSDYVAKGIPFIMASDLNEGLIDTETCHFISKDQADTLQKGFAKEGDVLLSHKGTVGEVAVVRKINSPYLMLTPQVTYYRVKDRNKLSNKFLAQLFVAESFQSNLVEVSGGGTRAYIGITEQTKLRLQLPKGIEEQQHIASCLSSLDALITAETQKLEALKTHKKGLMQQLFPVMNAKAEIEA